MKKVSHLSIKVLLIFFLSMFQAKSDTFYYSGGCFWCTEEDFEEFKGVQDSVNKVMSLVDKGDVNFNMGSLKKVEKNDNGKVTVTLDDETTLSDIDAIFPFFGLKIELGPIADWGLNLEKNLISVNTENFETSVPRVFAVGDICIYPGKLKLILSFRPIKMIEKSSCDSNKKRDKGYVNYSCDCPVSYSY